MYRRIAYFIVLSLVMVSSAFSAGNDIVLDIPATDEYPRHSEGDFVTLTNGDILFVWTRFYGGSADHSPSHLAAVRSSDGGRTWSEKPEVIVENFADQNVMSVSLLRLRDSSRIMLFYLVKNSFHDCRPYVQFSDDECRTWTEPRRIVENPGYYVVNNDRVVQLSTGRLVAPCAWHRPIFRNGKLSVDFRAIDIFLLSDDGGETWREAANWRAIPDGESTSGLQEPGVVELADGSIFCFARTDMGYQYGFWSHDHGETWSMPCPSSLVSPVSPASIERIPGTDDLLAVYNDHSGRFPFAEKRRNPMVVAISQDGGRTWPIARMIEDNTDGHFCYTAIEFVGKSVLLSYYAGQRSIADGGILRQRLIDLDWIYGVSDQ